MKIEPIVVTDNMVDAGLKVLQQLCPSCFLALTENMRFAMMADIYIAMVLEKVNE